MLYSNAVYSGGYLHARFYGYGKYILRLEKLHNISQSGCVIDYLLVIRIFINPHFVGVLGHMAVQFPCTGTN